MVSKVIGCVILFVLIGLMLKGAFILDEKEKEMFMNKCLISNNSFQCEYMYNNR